MQDAGYGKTPLFVVISGPSGVGKDALLSRMKEMGHPFFYAVTATTRPQRPGETEGVDYHFVNRVQFTEMIETGALLEWANVYGNLYGIPGNPIRQALSQGRDVILRVDIQGAAGIRSFAPEALLIFLAPPSMEELRRRLRERKTEGAAELDLRLKTAQMEMEALPSFDYVVVSESAGVDMAISQIQAIVTAEKCRVKPRAIILSEVFLDAAEKISGEASYQPAQ